MALSMTSAGLVASSKWLRPARAELSHAYNLPAKDFVAISLDEFRENWKYNLGDEKFVRFLAETPIYVQWDDHEVTNNWSPNEILTDSPYNGISANVLAQRARQAFFEYNPIRGEEIFRNYNHGKHLELFLSFNRKCVPRIFSARAAGSNAARRFPHRLPHELRTGTLLLIRECGIFKYEVG